MPKISNLSGSQVVKSFKKLGWEVARQRGSHIIMVKQGHNVTLSIPNHKTVAIGTLRKLIRISGLTVEQFENVI